MKKVQQAALALAILLAGSGAIAFYLNQVPIAGALVVSALMAAVFAIPNDTASHGDA